jgi:cytochrome c-type biogenesis protein CcmH
MKYALALILALHCALSSWAGEAVPLAEDPVVEQRMIAISEELRCLVCQNESLAGSRADLAQDLRRELRTLVKANKSDAEIKEYLVSRYGDFVLYKPPFKPVTWMLWFGPFMLLVAAIVVLVRTVRRNQRGATPAALDPDQRKKAQALLKDTGTPS